jgi:predicted transcriptional regulator of viral defense system
MLKEKTTKTTFFGNNFIYCRKMWYLCNLNSSNVKMNISNEILRFATNKQFFSRKELFEHFCNLSKKSLSQQLYRLQKNNRLERARQGVYRLPVSLFAVSDEIKQLNELLKTHFPFADFCLWSSNVLMPFMHHIPNLNFIYVDVENDVAESAFNFLKDNQTKSIFFRPNKEEFNRYITGTKAIIIRQLVSESPLQTIENVLVPTLEKVLVDIAGDVEFDFMQGAEITYFYRNVLDRNEINKKKLLRYASRRGRKEKVEQLYNNAL